MSSGKVVQVIGAVIDVEFPRDSVPQVYDALTVAEKGLTLEVQQQLGDGVVRAIAMGPSEGVSRGLNVENTGAPISVPVGIETLGRIMDVHHSDLGFIQLLDIHNARFLHLVVEVVSFSSPLTHTGEHGQSGVLGCNIVDELHHIDRFTHTGTAK